MMTRQAAGIMRKRPSQSHNESHGDADEERQLTVVLPVPVAPITLRSDHSVKNVNAWVKGEPTR